MDNPTDRGQNLVTFESADNGPDFFASATPFDTLTDEEVRHLRQVWFDPQVKEVFKKMKCEVLNMLGRRLRACPVEEVRIVRAEMDALDLLYNKISATVPTKEQQEEAKNASPDYQKIGPAI